MLATVYGCEAARMAYRGDYCRMVVLNKNELDSIAIEKIAGKSRLVTPDHRWVKAALGLGLSLGVPEDELST
jgi:ATP-dependent phosphofructokinase / diphosphate-dependent phosphofructokinase